MNIDETKLRQIISRLKTGNEETAKELEALLPLSFPELPTGEEWHNPARLTPEQVETDKGWRLITKSEANARDMRLEYQLWNDYPGRWSTLTYNVGLSDINYRTKLPLPTPFQFIVGQKYKTRGGGWAELRYTSNEPNYPLTFVQPDGTTSYNTLAGFYWSDKRTDPRDVLPIPYVPPKKRRVPLGPEDVPIGSVLRRKDDKEELECGVYQRNKWRVWAGTKDYEYGALVDNFEILRPNSTWQPAWKEIEE